MKTAVVLAEKKTLAEKIAKGLGKPSFKKDHYEVVHGDTKYLIYYLFGHILQVDLEKTFEKGYGHFPLYLKHRVAQGRSSLFKSIKDALEKVKKGEYDFVVSAGDPDREGELLVREVLEACKVPKEKVRRAWWNAETPKAVAEGVLKARPLSEYDALYQAGKARKIGDLWLGINLSRLLQAKSGNPTLSAGRVQSPVLVLVAQRYKEHEEFKPEPYWIVYAQLTKDGKTFTAKSSQIKEEEKAGELLERLKGKSSLKVLKVEKKRKVQAPPKLPKLSDIQAEVGKKLGLTSEEVLNVVQKLYQEGVLSYPRTEASYLSKGDLETVREFFRKTGRDGLIPKLSDPKVLKRIVNDKKVAEAGHHALIPIDKLPENASKVEKAVYEAVLRRLLANFMDDFIYDQTTVSFEEGLTAVGRKVVQLGWRELYGVKVEEGEEDSAQTLPQLKEGEEVRKVKEWAKKDFTKPPPLYTSASLITAMRKLGLGTEATRHTYEKVLIKRGYLKRVKGKLIPTPEGLKLAERIKSLSFASPEETARWEKLLLEIAFGRADKDRGFKEFLEGIKKLTQVSIKELEGEDFSYLSKKPSQKMVKYALSLAKKFGKEVDEKRLREDYPYCKGVIEELSKETQKLPPEPPTQAQLNFAKSIAQEKGIEIPEKALKDKREMARWLDSVVEKGKKRSKGKKFAGRKGKRRR